MVANNKKYTYEVVKSIVEESGYKLIQFFEPCKENNHKPKIIISNGYEEKLMYFDNFKRGRFKFRPNTDKTIKEFIENVYKIKLNYVKLMQLGKTNIEDLLEVSYKDKVIVRTIGSIKNSIRNNSNIFTDRNIERWTEESVYNFLSNEKFKLSNIRLEYDKSKTFNVRKCKIYFTYDKLELDCCFRTLKDRLLTGDESYLSINRGETFYKNLLFEKFKIINVGFDRIYKHTTKSGKDTFMADIYNINTREKVQGVLTDNLKKRGYWFKTYSGENKIKNCLEEMGIEYEQQKTFKDCKDKSSLRFDFYLPKYNTLIEYDGEFHYESIEGLGGENSFKSQQRRDKIKNTYCLTNGINLIRIPYFEKDNIPQIIQDIVRPS